jgi:hypothetical protein
MGVLYVETSEVGNPATQHNNPEEPSSQISKRLETEY